MSRLRPQMGFDFESWVCCRYVLLWCACAASLAGMGTRGKSRGRRSVFGTSRAKFSSSALAGQSTNWQMMH